MKTHCSPFHRTSADAGNESFTKQGDHRTQGDKTPTSEEQPHDENSLEEILQLRGLRSPFSDEPIYPGS